MAELSTARQEMSSRQAYLTDFLQFMTNSPSHFHATDNLKRMLAANQFAELHERNAWDLIPGGKYFFSRNNSCLVAFSLPTTMSPSSILLAMGAHTDSPCIKLKPITKMNDKDYLQINVQPYGGGIWHTWFDRDLTLAGRVFVENADHVIVQRLVHINRPIARIPTLAIHLTSADERNAFSVNLQTQLAPILGLTANHPNSSHPHHPALIDTIANELGVDAARIIDFELQLCELAPSVIGGLNSDLIYSGRLDNLNSCYQTIRALIDTIDNDLIKIVLLFDNEEIGSQSSQGASSTLLSTTLDRIALMHTSIDLSSSMVVSVDMAHGVHPNYRSKHDEHHSPVLGKGLVVKHNCNQRYATSTASSVLFQACVGGNGVQQFCVRNDSPCGSTIGPILSSLVGVRAVDVGSPQLSMHSIREVMAASDAYDGFLQLNAVFNNYFKVQAKFEID